MRPAATPTATATCNAAGDRPARAARRRSTTPAPAPAACVCERKPAKCSRMASSRPASADEREAAASSAPRRRRGEADDQHDDPERGRPARRAGRSPQGAGGRSSERARRRGAVRAARGARSGAGAAGAGRAGPIDALAAAATHGLQRVGDSVAGSPRPAKRAAGGELDLPPAHQHPDDAPAGAARATRRIRARRDRGWRTRGRTCGARARAACAPAARGRGLLALAALGQRGAGVMAGGRRAVAEGLELAAASSSRGPPRAGTRDVEPTRAGSALTTARRRAGARALAIWPRSARRAALLVGSDGRERSVASRTMDHESTGRFYRPSDERTRRTPNSASSTWIAGTPGACDARTAAGASSRAVGRT